MALAVGRALEQAVHDRTSSSTRRGKRATSDAPSHARAGRPSDATAADPSQKSSAKERRRRDLAAFEQRVGYRFKDPALLEQALTHISALSGARNRAASYQRLEFL